MNLVDITIIEIISEPRQLIDDEFCCWEVVVKTDCYGSIRTETFRAISKSIIDMYCVGYTYLG